MSISNVHDLVRYWYSQTLARYAAWEHSVDMPSADKTGLTIRIYTDNNCYSISAQWPRLQKYRLQRPGSVDDTVASVVADALDDHAPYETRMDNGYLGCIASSRKPRAGEGWTRGNDLADGELTEETWRRILFDIVSYEMVKVHRPVESMKDAGMAPTPG